MHFEPVEFHAPEPERLTLDNGMVVYLLEDHELPLVTITAKIQAGGWLDPADKVGLAGIAGTTMRTGGTARMSAEEVDEELDRLAAHISVGMGVESGSATLDVLKKDLDRGLRIFADILRTPAFDPARVELAKLRAIEGIRRRQDQPGVIAGMEFAKMMYGADHPYARESTVESVSRLTREDVVRFHAHTLHPNGIILGVTGDFERDRILDALRDVFGDWKPGDVPSITWTPAGGDPGSNGKTGIASKKTVRLVGKVTSQTHLRVGHPSIKETHPDYAALSVLNDILGGSSFRSRLFRT
ncbi:MAG: M16 family metallopeptidase, partial [Nitrospirales bacterium]